VNSGMGDHIFTESMKRMWQIRTRENARQCARPGCPRVFVPQSIFQKRCGVCHTWEGKQRNLEKWMYSD